jgi:4-diphosphocytidyl-2-C-methyl-D-erythritol kinase
MIVYPNAKINLGLNILRKREDGFHEIASVFYPVKWKDALEVVRANHLKFTSGGLAIPGTVESNLCLKAYTLLKEAYDIPPVHIHLHKVLPMGGGLGGGSSDAAFTLRVLNEMFSLHLETNTLKSLAAKLGSDCAFFIDNTPQMATGRGEVLTPFNLNLKGYKILLVYPAVGVSTPWAYSQIKPKAAEYSITETLQGPIENWKNQLVNDFEAPIFEAHPELGEIKEALYEFGAVYASMSGSGSTLFGIFKSSDPLPLEQLQMYGYNCFIHEE